MSQTGPLITFEHFSFSYEGGRFPGLSDLNLNIYPGEFVLLTGKSGYAMPCILGCVSGIIYVVMLSKLTIRGGIFIGSVLFGLCMINMTPHGFMFFTSLVGGILGELVYFLIGKASFKGQVAGICTIALAGAVGQYAPFIFMQDAYLALYADNSSGTLPVVEYGIEHVTIPFALIVTVFYIGFTILGCFWGRKIVERHLKKAQTK